MKYFLKLVGLSTDPLPEKWWIDRPEIVDGIFFSSKPKPIFPGDILIYYAVGGDGRLCGVVEVLAEATKEFEAPPHWPAIRRKKFPWRSRVALIHKCPADRSAPRLCEFHDKRVGQGSFQRLGEEEAKRMIAAISETGAAVAIRQPAASA